jgi:hypothetical protein
MWWSQEEEDLQQQFTAAWGEADDDDIADLAADPPDPPDEDVDLGGEAGAAVEGGPPAAFPWHIPEGAPLPVIDPDLPMVNGFHILLPPLNLFQGGADAH